MATRNPSAGMAHLTVVPENFDPTADDETATRGDGADERASGDEAAGGDDELVREE